MKNIIAFNWRSETRPMEVLLPCASTLVAAARDWASVYPNHSVFLVSDISLSENITLWSGMKSKTPENVLTLLKLHFFKLEELSGLQDFMRKEPIYADRIFFSVFDMIISQKAEVFIPCDDTNSAVCSQCSRTASNFVREIKKVRNSTHLPSANTWILPGRPDELVLQIPEYELKPGV